MLGWYFAPENGRLANGDGRRIRVGLTHSVDAPVILCRHGLHASERVIDALTYSTSSILYRVRLSGLIVRGDDKACATTRTYVARINAENVLREFARRCALQHVKKWDAPPVVVEYLKTGNPKLRSVAWSAAWSAARSASRSASRSAARSASRSASRSAAWSAAQSAAWSAAQSAAESAAWSAQNRLLEKLVRAAMRE
jgi:hypothetical protein